MLLDEKHYRARITKRVDFAPDLWMIRIDPGAEFSFAPGQYATLGVERDTRRRERPYSIASSPHEKELEFFFELVPQGETTPPLYDLQLGDEVLLRKVAKGRFTLDTAQPDRTNHLMVSTVTGVAPFVSYVRTLFKDWKEGRFAGDHKLFLLNGASRSWEFGYREELENFAKHAPWFRCVFAVSRPWEDDGWKGEVGRVDDLLRKYADQWGCTGANTIGYLCGHPEMIEHGKGILKRIGFERENFKEEVYWVPAKAAAGV
jgi:ferredoxin/flavodoxin---NADP+ reductase